jgi:hypothetical protein
LREIVYQNFTVAIMGLFSAPFAPFFGSKTARSEILWDFRRLQDAWCVEEMGSSTLPS